MRYEAFCFADPVFYDTLERWQRSDAGFPHAAVRPPAGWRRQPKDLWVMFVPDDVELPSQGWKIHVSATQANAELLLDKVSEYCFTHHVAFKLLRGAPVLLAQNSKYAPRGSSGKLLTLYPVDEAELERTLNELDALVGGEPGPYILSDLRWNAGPLFVRYGGFAEIYRTGDDGRPELAIRRPDGELVPDTRSPVFTVPPWVEPPACLAPQLEARNAQRLDLPYEVERVLHFSNGGGIYLARAADGRQVVLKEGRPHAGLDHTGTDAVTRLAHEHDILSRLRGLAVVPDVLELTTSWEHHYLVEEYVPGETLNASFVHRYPLIRPGADPATLSGYAAWVEDVIGRIERGLREIHERGVVFGDLHPRNIMVRPDGEIVFLDFELASPIDEYHAPTLGASGFAAPPRLSGFEADWYAVASLRLWLLIPLTPMLHLDRDKLGHLTRAAGSRFPVSGPFLAHAADVLRPPDAEPAGSAAEHIGELLDPAGEYDWPALRDAIAAGITASATPDRADRLFPGDIEQFTYGGQGIAYGAAGVLYALHAAGAPVDPAHTAWLIDAARRETPAPGAYTGAHGVAYVLDRLGHRAEAIELLHRVGTVPLTGRGPDLAGGLAGVGLVHLHFARATGEDVWLQAARVVTGRLADWLQAAPPRRNGRMGEAREGLLHGASGAALLALRLYETAGDPGDTALLDLAERALQRDLDACVIDDDGTAQVRDGGRVLPYVETGSTGIGLVLRDLLTHRPDSPLAAMEAPIARTADIEFVIQSGLFNGRAGLIAHLARLRDAGQPVGAILDRHIRRLLWHAVSYQGHLAFPGDQILRLSMDVSTGSAGVLLALNAALGTGESLPFLGASAPHELAAGRPRENNNAALSYRR